MKSLATALAATVGAAAVVGAAAAGVTSIASSSVVAAPQMQLVVSGAPMPLDPADDLPTPDQLYAVLNGLANPGVPFRSKGNLVEGGVGIIEGRTADAVMKNAVAEGKMPLSFSVSDITPVGPGAASANVTASGPALAPTTQNVTFVDRGGWKLSRGSATQVLTMFSG